MKANNSVLYTKGGTYYFLSTLSTCSFTMGRYWEIHFNITFRIVKYDANNL